MTPLKFIGGKFLVVFGYIKIYVSAVQFIEVKFDFCYMM